MVCGLAHASSLGSTLWFRSRLWTIVVAVVSGCRTSPCHAPFVEHAPSAEHATCDTIHVPLFPPFNSVVTPCYIPLGYIFSLKLFTLTRKFERTMQAFSAVAVLLVLQPCATVGSSGGLLYAGKKVVVKNADDVSQAIQWPDGWENVNGQTNQEFKFYKYRGDVAGGLGQGASEWATDGTTEQILVGDTVAWYHPTANQIYDCSTASCSLQAFPLPGGNWGSPYRIYTLSGDTGDQIACSDTVYFDRMSGQSSWNSAYSLAASPTQLKGVFSMNARSEFKLSCDEAVEFSYSVLSDGYCNDWTPLPEGDNALPLTDSTSPLYDGNDRI